MEGFNDFVFVIAGENESAVVGELLNTRSKKELYVGSGIVCFINDDDFVLRSEERETVDAKFFGVITDSIEKPSFIGTINDININS